MTCVVLAFVVGCSGGITLAGDGDVRPSSDADTEAHADHDVDAYVVLDGDAGPDADAGADGDADAGTCSGVWRDPTTGYLWENPPSETWRTWEDAVSYCDGLSLCGYPAGSWHLPTISELRSLIRGCPGTERGGACGLTDSCPDYSCFTALCLGCSYRLGPGGEGCYWDAGLMGTCWAYWSSSLDAGGSYYAWYVGFHYGYVRDPHSLLAHYARCVRSGP